MKKPEILTGEVKEFIDECKLLSFNEEPINFIQRLNDIKRFYSQPFKPEMITEYFGGIDNLDGGLFYDRIDGRILIDIVTQKYIEYGGRGINYFRFFYPQTLSQFITNCIQSGIKLQWRER